VGLNFLACAARRGQEKAEARLCFDVELAIAPGLGKNQKMFYFKRAIQDIRQNRFLNLVTIVTIALSILIVSAFVLFLLNTNDLIQSWEKGMRIMVYLESNLTGAQIPEVEERIRKFEDVESVRFISREAALAQMKEQMGRQSSLLENLRENPLPDSFEISLTAGRQTAARIELLARRIETLPEVAEVEYGQSWIKRFSGVLQLFRLAGYALGGLFFLAAIFFVANTIRLVLYSRREEVAIMRLVGAEDRFIKTPFYIQGLIQGALGGLIGLSGLLLLFLLVSSNVEQSLTTGMFQIHFLPLRWLALILLAGMLVGWLGCFLSLRQYLEQ
jgi:cell division transport system permease protein